MCKGFWEGLCEARSEHDDELHTLVRAILVTKERVFHASNGRNRVGICKN